MRGRTGQRGGMLCGGERRRQRRVVVGREAALEQGGGSGVEAPSPPRAPPRLCCWGPCSRDVTSDTTCSTCSFVSISTDEEKMGFIVEPACAAGRCRTVFCCLGAGRRTEKSLSRVSWTRNRRPRCRCAARHCCSGAFCSASDQTGGVHPRALRAAAATVKHKLRRSRFCRLEHLTLHEHLGPPGQDQSLG